MRLLLLLSLCALSFSLHAQTADDMVQEGNTLVKDLKEEDAYQKYKDALVVQPDNLQALWRASDMASRIGARQTDKSKALTFYTEAQDLASRALKVDSASSDAWLMMATALSEVAGGESAKKKVAYWRDVKTYCDKAVHLDPKNYRAYHLLGLWNVEMFHVSGVERAEAKVLYGGLPDASIKQAIVNFQKCRSIYPSFILNYLDLAKVLKADDQSDQSISTLETLVRLPVQTEDDPAIKAEGRKMLDSQM